MVQLQIVAVPQQLQTSSASPSTTHHHLPPVPGVVVVVVVVDDVGGQLPHDGRPAPDRGRTEQGGLSEVRVAL